MAKLDDLFDRSQIRRDPEALQVYGSDWTKHFEAHPSAVVFPKSTEQMQSLIRWARESKTALVPSGGRTGLSAGAFACHGEVVVSLERMNQILSFNSVDQIVHCQAGVVTEHLQNFVKEKGYFFPVDFASRGSSQIGGNIATNAGGVKVIRYGLMRQWVAGLTVVTGEGEILKLNNGLVKNASGYDFRHLFIGSEGTLGLISEAQLRVTTAPKELVVMVFGVNELSAVMKIYEVMKKQLPLTAFEMFTDLALKYVLAMGRHQAPFVTRSPFYLLVEVENESERVMETAMALFEEFAEAGWVMDGTVSQSPTQAQNLWSLREDITEATTHKQPYKNDVSVGISRVPDFLSAIDRIMKQDYPNYEVVWFGHIGDGNLHINILKPDQVDNEEFMSQCHRVDDILFEMIEKYGGSISAEHGVGLVKKPFLHHTRSPQEISYMKRLKQIFDPDHILNPGKIF